LPLPLLMLRPCVRSKRAAYNRHYVPKKGAPCGKSVGSTRIPLAVYACTRSEFAAWRSSDFTFFLLPDWIRRRLSGIIHLGKRGNPGWMGGLTGGENSRKCYGALPRNN
jgi:hypothetical protein